MKCVQGVKSVKRVNRVTNRENVCTEYCMENVCMMLDKGLSFFSFWNFFKCMCYVLTFYITIKL